jgi:hypothetical protein
LHSIDDASIDFVVPEGDQHLIQHNVVKNFTASGAKGICECCSMLTASVDEVDNTLFSEGTQRRPDFNCSSATRRFRPELHWLPFRVTVRSSRDELNNLPEPCANWRLCIGCNESAPVSDYRAASTKRSSNMPIRRLSRDRGHSKPVSRSGESLLVHHLDKRRKSLRSCMIASYG